MPSRCTGPTRPHPPTGAVSSWVLLTSCESATLLAQSGPFAGTQAPPPLPSPPRWEYLVAGPPAVMVLALAAFGIAGFVLLVRQGRRRAGWWFAGVVAVLTAAVAVLNPLVTTERERLRTRTADLIAAAASAEQAALTPLLAEDVVLSLGGQTARAGAAGRARILELVERYPGGIFRVRSHAIAGGVWGGGRGGGVQAVIDSGNTARSQVRVRATLEDSGFTAGSWWRLHWRRDDGVWRVTGIDLLAIDGVSDVGQLRP